MADWTSSMTQTFEYYVVDPGTWKEVKLLDNVKSCTIERDAEVETLGSATIDVTDSVGECYIPTSLRPYNDFVNACFVMKQRPVYAGLVQIGLKRVDGANPYSVATFKKIRDFMGDELMQVKAYATSFREQIKQLNMMRAEEAMNRSDAEPFYEDGSYNSTGDGTHFEISSNDTLNGDTDDLPM